MKSLKGYSITSFFGWRYLEYLNSEVVCVALLALSTHAHRFTVVTLSGVSLFDFGEGTVFRVETYISTI